MGVSLGTCLFVGLAQDDSTEQKAPNTHIHVDTERDGKSKRYRTLHSTTH